MVFRSVPEANRIARDPTTRKKSSHYSGPPAAGAGSRPGPAGAGRDLEAAATRSLTEIKLTPNVSRRWTGSRTRRAGVRLIDGIVHFEGEIRKTGKNPILFTLPPKFRPVTNVDLHVNMCTGSLGQLSTTPKGVVREHSEENLTFAPRCGISLDGASFALSSQSFAPLKLINGWKTAKGTAAAAIRLRSGFVQFRGAISSTAGSTQPLVLPAKYRPATNVYVTVDLCDGNNGRLFITSDGVVTIVAENGDNAAAQCLISLEGTWFAPLAPGLRSMAGLS